MKSLLLKEEAAYDGTQLRSLFGYLEQGVQGDSVIAWIGPCAIAFEHMIDGEDLLAQSPICGARMVHFLIEKFHTPLFAAVALQRLFASICLELLRESAGDLRREGDDLYWRDGKLSISIATLSPVSALIHFAVNVTNEGTPVKTSSLEDLGVDARSFAQAAMERLIREVRSIEEATVKVRWAR